MPQIAQDANGNKIRWDEKSKRWVPVEKASDAAGNIIEFDGQRWSPAGQPVGQQASQQAGLPARPVSQQARPKWYENYLGLVRRMVGGAQGTMAGGMNSLIKAADFISDKLGIPKSDAARMIARDLGIYSQANKEKGTPGVAGDVAAGLGGAAVDIPIIAAMGPAGLPVHGAVMGAAQGGVPGALTGAAQGALSGGVLKGMSGMSLPGRVGAGAAFGAATTPGGVQERVSGAATMGALGALGGEKQRQVIDQRNARADKITTTPGEAKPAGPVGLLVDALKKAPRLLPKQKAMYAKEAGQRLRKAEDVGLPVGGEAGFKAAYAEMKGELEKVAFEPPKIDAANRESLFQMIWDDPMLTQGERFSTESGLRGMLDNGKFPAKHEVELMNRVYGNELTAALVGKMTRKEQVAFWGTQIANIPRTIQASFDLSAPLRQGIWLTGRPREFGRAFKDMFKSLFSDEGYRSAVQAMAQKPTFKLARESGLALAEIGSALNKTEERFLGSGVIERMGTAARKKMPGLVGKAIDLVPQGIKVTQRAYTGFLNKLRADTFDRMVNDAAKLGLYNDAETGETNLWANDKLSGDIARYVNIATGRGTLKGLAESNASILNATFFSPRLMSARLALFDPRTYLSIPEKLRPALEKTKMPFSKATILEPGSQPKVSKFVRHRAIKDAARFFGLYTTATALSKFVLDQEVGSDPRSADFTKIKSGNTRVDLAGGIGSYARTAIQLSQPLFKKLGIIDEAYLVSSSSGKKTKMGGGYSETSLLDILYRFFSQKENPIVSSLTTVLSQSDPQGGPVNAKREVVERITPIIAQDLVELYKDDPDGLKMAVMGLLTLFGAGVQTYGNKSKQGKSIR